MVKRYNSKKIEQLIYNIYKGYGFTEEESQEVAHMLIYTDLIGIESHGVQRMIMYDDFIRNGKIRVHNRPEVVKETDVSAVVDAHFGLGQLNGIYSMRLAIEKAKQHGIGIVTTRNSGHYGIAGYYANMAAEWPVVVQFTFSDVTHSCYQSIGRHQPNCLCHASQPEHIYLRRGHNDGATR